MGSMWIRWFQPWYLLTTAATLARLTGGHVLLNYPATSAYAQSHNFVPIIPPPTTYATQTIGVPVVSSQSSFFLRSVPRFVTPAVVASGVPVTPGVVASGVPVTPGVVASGVPVTPGVVASGVPVTPGVVASGVPATPGVVASAVPVPPGTPTVPPEVPLPTSPSRAAPVPAYLVYSDGDVIPLTDSYYKLPPVIEGVVNRVQNYFSNYVHVDPHLLPFPVQNQHNAKIQKLAVVDNSSNAVPGKTGNAVNLRLVALPGGQFPIAFTRTSTVPTSSGRTAKLVEVFRPPGNDFSGPADRPAQGGEQNRYAVPINIGGQRNTAPPPNRPSEFPPEGSNAGNKVPPGGNFPPNGDRPQVPDSRPPVPPNGPNRPRPERPGQGRPEPSPPKGYRYDRPLRPLEYDIPPKREAYRFNGPF